MATRLIVLILLFAPGLARADKRQRARELFAAGKAHYAAKHYEQAIAAFRKAASVWPSPVLISTLLVVTTIWDGPKTRFRTIDVTYKSGHARPTRDG